MKEMLIQKLIGVVLSLMTPDLIKSFADLVLDWVEDAVLGSKSTVDDALVLPLCETIRKAMGIQED